MKVRLSNQPPFVSLPPSLVVQITSAAVETASDIFGIPAEIDNNAGIHESVAIVQVC